MRRIDLIELAEVDRDCCETALRRMRADRLVAYQARGLYQLTWVGQGRRNDLINRLTAYMRAEEAAAAVENPLEKS